MVDGVSDSTVHGGGSWGRWFGCVFLQITILSFLNFGLKKHRRSGAMYAIACSEKVLLPIAQKTGEIEPNGQRKFIPLLFKPKIRAIYQWSGKISPSLYSREGGSFRTSALRKFFSLLYSRGKGLLIGCQIVKFP